MHHVLRRVRGRLSAGIGLFIFPRTWTLLKEAVGVLLEGTPADVNVSLLRETVGKSQELPAFTTCNVWSLISRFNAMSAHVVLADGVTQDAVLRGHGCVTREFKIAHATIQLEREGCAAHAVHL